MGPRSIPITDEIYQVGGPSLTAADDAAIYLIALADQAVLIDSGCGRSTDLLLANVESTGVLRTQISHLLLTHCHFDHTGGAAQLRALLGCLVTAHELDAPYIESADDEVTAATWYGSTLRPCIVDRRLSGHEQTIEVAGRSISALHIPGHSPGSVAYLMSSGGNRVVFAQDVHGPLHASLLSNRQDYQRSLRKLLDLHADILCEGHYGMFRGQHDIAGFIRRFIE